MVNERLRAELPDEALVYDNPSFDLSIIGVSQDDCVIYNYNYMVAELMYDEEMDYDEAVDFIDYNTLRAYSNKGNMPIVMFTPLYLEEVL